MKVGFVGIGTMGEHMCRRIMQAGYEMSVYDVNAEQIQKLASEGAAAKDKPADLAAASDVVILMVATNQQIRDVILGQDGLLKALKPGSVIIIMSTVSPNLCVEMAQPVREAGSTLMEAPVVKSQPAAISGDLGIYVGGPLEAYEKVKPILECMGSNIIRMGDVGKGMTMKLCHNMMTQVIVEAVSEMLVTAKKAGLEFDDVVAAISYGGGQNFFLDSKAATIKKRDFAVKFALGHIHKDLGLALEMANALNLNLPAVSAAKQVLNSGMAMNLGWEDFSATIKVIEKFAGLAE